MDLDRLKRRICLLLCLSLSASGTGLPALAATRAASAQVAKASVGDDELRDKLKDVVERAEQVDPSESTETFQETLDQAKGVLADPTASADEIDAVYQALQETMHSLVTTETVPLTVRFNKIAHLSVDGEDLKLANLTGLYETEIVPGESFTLVFAPSVEGQEFRMVTINGDEFPFDNTMDTYSYSYEGTMGQTEQELSFVFNVVSKEVLRAVLEKAEELSGSEAYDVAVPAVQKNLDNALENARVVCDSHSATQAEINQAGQELLEAVLLLPNSMKGDKSLLASLLDITSKIVNKSYTEDSWQTFEQARETAQAVYDNPDALQQDIDRAYMDLSDATFSLIQSTDLPFLHNVLAEAEALDLSKFAETGKADFLAALEEAKRVSEDVNPSQQAIDRAVLQLTNSMKTLQLLPDKSALMQLVDEVNAMDLSKYTSASVARLQAALEIAQTVLDHPDATQQEVNEAYASLKEVMLKLEKISSSSESHGSGSSWSVWGQETLEAAISYANALRESDAYTEATADVKRFFDTAYANAKETAKQEDALTEIYVSTANQLFKVFSLLTPSGDQELLLKLTNSVDQIDQNLSFRSPKELKDALSQAKIFLQDPEPLQVDIEKAIKQLNSAVASLCLKVANRRSLEVLLKYAEETKASEAYKNHSPTRDTQLFESAIKSAQYVLAKKDADQSELDEARTHLLLFWTRILNSWGDTSYLPALIGIADSIDTDLYAKGVYGFDVTLKEAQEVAGKENTHEGDRREAISRLASAIRGLRLTTGIEPAYKDVLLARINDAKDLRNSDAYKHATPSVQKVFDEVYEHAQECYAQKGVYQSEVDASLLNLLNASRLFMDSPGYNRAFAAAVLETASAFDTARYPFGVILFKDAADDLVRVLDDENATYREIRSATKDLLYYIQELVPEENMLQILREFSAEVQLMDLSVFPDQDAVKVRNALYKAKLTVEKSTSTFSEVEDAYYELYDAVTELYAFQDNILTDYLLLEAGLLKEEDYTPASWESFYPVYLHTKDICNNPDSHGEDRIKALNQLSAAFSTLVSFADKSSLKAVLNAREELISWVDSSPNIAEPDDFREIIESSENIYGQSWATQESVDQARDRILRYLYRAEIRADQPAVDLLLQLTEPLESYAYTSETFAVFTQAWESAKHAGDENRQAALNNLLQAVDNLAYNTQKERLQSIVDEIKTYHLPSYITDSCYYDLIDALKEAEYILKTPSSTQFDVDYYEAILHDRAENLQIDPSKMLLGIALERADSYQWGIYTLDSWDSFYNILSYSKTNYENPGASSVWSDVDSLIEETCNLKIDSSRYVLNELIHAADEITLSDYAPTGKEAFIQDLTDAKWILSDHTSEIHDIITAQDRLLTSISALQAVSDKTELFALIQQAEEYKQEDYVSSTWSAFVEALETAKAVQGNPNATQKMVDDALQALCHSVDNLTRRIDKSVLLSLISVSSILREADYTSDSWNVFKTALDHANTVHSNANATQEEVSKAVADLQDAMKGLQNRPAAIDKSVLLSLISVSSILREADYTSDSWNVFKTALDHANTVHSNANATQEEVSKAVVDLQDAMKGLQNRPAAIDKSALLSLISVSSILREADYTANSWNAFKTALDTANTVHGDPSATQEEVSKAVTDLQNAIKGLQNRPAAVDKSALLSLISVSSILREADYTANSWNTFKTALDQANTVHSNANATQEEVSKAAAGLQNAIKGLQNRPATIDKSALLSLISVSSILREADYTANSWNVFKTALGQANTVHSNANATQEEVSKATTDLQNAIKGLQNRPAVVDKSLLAEEIDHVKTLDQTNYTVISWLAVINACKKAEAVYKDDNATQSMVNDAIIVLRQAVDGLVETVKKENLQKEIAAAENILKNETDKDLYTPVSWNALDDALKAAKTVANQTDASQAEVDNAYHQLRNARDNLSERGSKEVLQGLINRATSLVESDYNVDSWTLLTNVLKQANLVKSDLNATISDVSEAENALNYAITSLIPLPVTERKTNLKALLDDANRLKQSNYKPETWQPFSLARSVAQDIYDNSNLRSEFDDAYAYLNRTKGGLKEISSGGGGGHGGGGGGGGSSGGGGGGSTGGEGTAAVTTGTTTPVTVPQGSFVSSLTGTVSLTLGTAQQFTVTSATAPVMTQGNGKVAQLHVVKPFDGKSMTLQVYGIGHPGEGTGIYANGQLLFTISLAKAPFVCDTTVDVKVGQNKPYWFTVTPDNADQVPSMTVGNGSVLQTAAGKKVKNANGTTTYYFAVKGIGKPGEGTGVFISLNGVQYKLFNCGIQ